MTDNDPFAEPDDSERTVIRPNPGGRRTQSAPATLEQATPHETAAAGTTEPGFGVPPSGAGSDGGSASPDVVGVEFGLTGTNRLNACAATLFSLVSRIRNRAQHMDPEKLRQSVVAEIRAFENRGLQSGIDAQDIKVARYAICATLDDVVLNTPWGGQSVWTQQSMVGTFHRETVGGDRFYDLLARLEKEPSNNIDLLEFVYMCLSLGFEGRLRVEQNGSDKHLQIRAGLARIIAAQRQQVERDLSPNWEGVDKPHKVLSAWKPVWITTGIVSILLTVSFLTFSYLLSGSTERVIGQLSVLGSDEVAELLRRAPPPPPAPPQAEQVEQMETVKSFLRAEIDQGKVTVFQDTNTITIRTLQGLFGSGSDRLSDSYIGAIEKVAAALNEQRGAIIVVGHSDNIPIRSSRYPSNLHLSLARAKSVMLQLASGLNDPSRLSAEGRADTVPIATNDTREGRNKNRRIEILLVKDTGL
jgi:type VI secretion system protein ImpK